MSRAPVFAFTHERNEREQLGFNPTIEGAVLRVQVTSPAGCVRLSKANVDALKRHVRDALEHGASVMVVNVRDCLDIDSYAMGTLYSMRHTFHRVGGYVVIEDADSVIQELFTAYGLAGEFTFAFRSEVAP